MIIHFKSYNASYTGLIGEYDNIVYLDYFCIGGQLQLSYFDANKKLQTVLLMVCNVETFWKIQDELANMINL